MKQHKLSSFLDRQNVAVQLVLLIVWPIIFFVILTVIGEYMS